MKIRHLVFSLLPALVVADEATTVPDDEPLLPPLPEELLSPQKGAEGLPATAQPVVSYRAPQNEEQTWLKLLYVKDSETWPEVFRRMATASHEKDMEMCHGYALWMKGQALLHLRYDDDLSLSGIHADGHAYGVLFVEFNPYGIRVCPMEGYDLTGKNGGVCWQDAATLLWSWADAEKFWAELPKLLKAGGKTKATSAQDSAVKREVATMGQRMVVFWAPAGYPAKTWWPSFARLHAAVGPHRFSLVAADGLKLWTDVVVPSVKPTSAAPAAPVAGNTPAASPAPGAPTPITAAPPPQVAPGKAPAAPAAGTTPPPAPANPPAASPAPAAPATTTAPAPSATAPAAPASPPAQQPPVPDKLQPATGTPRDVAPDASVRPWALEGGVAPAPSSSRKTTSSAPAPAAPSAASGASGATGAAPATPAGTAPAPSQPTAPPSPAPPAAPAEPAPAPTGRTLDSVPSIPH